MTTPATTWSTKRLADVADLCLGKMLDQNKNRGEYLPYLANVNVRWGSFDLSGLREMRFESHERTRYGLQFGDIVMCEGGEPGRCALWRDEHPGMMIQKALHRIRARDGLDNRFLYYSLLHGGRTGGFASLFTGATIRHLPGQNLAKIEVPFPPLPIQERVADVLSAYDDLIENNRRRIQLLQEKARLIYEEWFVCLRFPGCEHVTITDGTPKGWRRKTIGEVCPFRYGKALKKKNRRSGAYPVFGSSGIVDTHDTGMIAGPGIVIGRKGNVGSAFWSGSDFWPIDTVYYIDSRRCTIYIYYALRYTQFINTDVAVPGLNRNFAHSRELLIPDDTTHVLFEQHILVLHRQMDQLAQQNRALAHARDLLLPRLLSGEIAA